MTSHAGSPCFLHMTGTKLSSQRTAGQIASLQIDLTAERQARREAEATCTSLSHDRQRLQRARDELASNLLVILLSFLCPCRLLTIIL